MADAVTELTHDHVALNRQVLAASSALRHLAPTSTCALLEPQLSELRDALFLHFSREEEGLFPFVTEVAPHLEPQVTELLVAHDMICGALSRAVYLASTNAATSTITPVLERFENSYAEHSQREAILLGTLERALDQAQRASLSAVVASL